jgi:tetratricopeptide (TPR) repeat protein
MNQFKIIFLLLIISYSLLQSKQKIKKIDSYKEFEILADKYLFAGASKEAIDNYTKAILINPKNANLYLNRGIAKAQDNNCSDAHYDFDLALKFNFESKYLVYYNKAFCFSKDNNPQMAIVLYSKAIAENPKYANSYNNRGVENVKLRNYAEALIDYQNASKYDSNNFTIYYNIAKIKNYFKDKNEAIYFLNKSLKIREDYKESLILRAECYVYLNQLDKAITDYSKLLDIEKDNTEYMLKRGYCYSKANVYALACADFKRAKELKNPKADDFVKSFCK